MWTCRAANGTASVVRSAHSSPEDGEDGREERVGGGLGEGGG